MKYVYAVEIFKYMNKKGLNQAQFAKRVGLTRFDINNICNFEKRVTPGPNKREKLDRFFDEYYSANENIYK